MWSPKAIVPVGRGSNTHRRDRRGRGEHPRQELSILAVVVLGALCVLCGEMRVLPIAASAAAREAPVLLPWHDDRATMRQVVRVSAPVTRTHPVAEFALAAGHTGGVAVMPGNLPLRIVTADEPGRPLPVYRDGASRVRVRIPGDVAPGRPRMLLAYWSRARGSPELDSRPEDTDDYATSTYGDGWDFDEGDFETIRRWGDRPTEYGKVEVRDGRLIVPVTGGDPYFIWGGMFGSPGDDSVEHIDSKLYRTLRMRVRQTCTHAKWSIFLTDTRGAYQADHFSVRGKEDQELSFDLADLFPKFWDGREFRALRIDPTNDAPGTTVEIDWVKLLRPAVETEVGPRLSLEQVKARAGVFSLRASLPKTAGAGGHAALVVRGHDPGGRPLQAAPFAVSLREDGRVVSTHVIVADRSGSARSQLPVGTRAVVLPAEKREWVVGICDDLGRPAEPLRTAPLRVSPAPLDHYELAVASNARLVLVSQPRVKVSVWGSDRFGNRIPVDIRAPGWELSGGAEAEKGAVKGAPAEIHITCAERPLTRHEIVLRDRAGRTGKLELMTMALKERAVRVSPNGYLVDAGGKLFLPLGGFYANWPAGVPDRNGAIRRAVDLFPCGPTRYPHGFPWPAEVERQVTDFLKLCSAHGVTALRLMLRNMDIVGRVDPVQLKAVLHLFDMAWELGIRFNVVLFEDYTKPPYISREVLEKVVLPHYPAEELRGLPPHRAKFLVEKRILARPVHRYTDPDAIRCQKDYLTELLPHLAPREEIFCYELENEMVRPPISWVNEMTEFIRGIDPRTPVLGNPGPHRWPEPWRWREAKVELFSYHPYTDGQPDADHGAVVLMRSKWAMASGLPMFTGEGGVNQNRWQKGVRKSSSGYAARAIRDQVWLSMCCGACGAFMWTAGHELEMAEFGKVRPALSAAGIDLLDVKRRRPRTVVLMPEDATANARACALAWRLMGLGVDFDTLPAGEAEGYDVRIAPAQGAARGVAAELIRPGEGYQLSYLASEDLGQVLVYLRNVAGGIVNLGNGRACYLREPGPAKAAIHVLTDWKWTRLSAYDLDAGEEVTVRARDGGRTLVVGRQTPHDYVVGLQK